MTTPSFPVRTSSSRSALFGEQRSSSVVSFRPRSPIDIADQFSVELNDDSIRTINCDECVMQHTNTCNECVVHFLLTADLAAKKVAMTAPEADTLELLQATGLAPRSQFATRPVSLDSRRLAPING